jgi:hypothetical protein
MVKGRGRLLPWEGLATGRGEVGTSVRLWVTDMSFRFKWRRNWGRRREVCIVTSRQNVANHYLSSGSVRGSREVVTVIT